jgi:hypothetical protein
MDLGIASSPTPLSRLRYTQETSRAHKEIEDIRVEEGKTEEDAMPARTEPSLQPFQRGKQLPLSKITEKKTHREFGL